MPLKPDYFYRECGNPSDCGWNPMGEGFDLGMFIGMENWIVLFCHFGKAAFPVSANPAVRVANQKNCPQMSRSLR